MENRVNFKVPKKFQGSNLLRYRIILATLTHTPLIIDNIRNYESLDGSNNKVGLKDYEIEFLKLIDKVTNGTLIEINESGTRLKYLPGTLVGTSKLLRFECPTSRSVSYFIEPLLLLLPFAKEATNISLFGCTYHDLDISIDTIRAVLIPILNKLFNLNDIKIELRKRCLAPQNSGEVILYIPIIPKLKTIHLLDYGMIKRIRGLCYTIAMAPTIANRVRTACNNVLYKYISDVWIFTDKTARHELLNNDNNKKNNNNISSGYGLSLVAETTTGILISVHQQCNNNLTAEEFGEYVSKLLLQEIQYGGTVDISIQGIILIFMSLCSEDVSRIRIGRLTSHSVEILRLIKDFLGITFKLKEDSSTGTIFASCLGSGYVNVWRQAS